MLYPNLYNLFLMYKNKNISMKRFNEFINENVNEIDYSQFVENNIF